MTDNSLTQYLDIFRSNRRALDDGSAPVINALRDEAAAVLTAAGRLPERRDEGFEKTSIAEMFAPDYGLNVNRVDMHVDAAASFKCDIPNMSTLLAIVANDKFVPTTTLVNNLPDGVEVMSLAEAARRYPERFAATYGSVAPINNSGVALNTMLVQDGVYIRFAAGVHPDRPVQVVNIFSAAAPMMAVRRVLIDMGKNAEGHVILCDHSQGTDIPYAASQVVEVICRAGAHLSIVDMEESSADTVRYNQIFARQEADSSLRINTATLLNGSTRNEFNVDIDGAGCSTGLYGMAIGSGRQHIDNSSFVRHNARSSASNQLFKYVLDDKATGAFEGSIEVTPSAPFTEAYQSNNNILASADARMHTKPQLLIYNDDVKCSHGATTGQLDGEALFYMQARGIPQAEARTMLMQAFMVDVINTINHEAMRDRLRHLVEKRFDGTLASCPACGSACHKG